MLNGEFDQFTEKYNFEEIKTHVLSPDEDLFAALNVYVKVALDPQYTYTINRVGDLITNFYLIGNGARINVTCTEPRVCCVRNALAGPSIGGMHMPTFHNCVFVGSPGTGQTGDLLACFSNVLLHGCHFIDWDGVCVRSQTGLVARGCFFVACGRCIRATGDYQVSVKHCTFKCCVVCVATKCDFEIMHNTFDECYSGILTSGTGRISKNSMTGAAVESISRFKDLVMTTCSGGVTHILCSIHISENRRKMAPRMDDNNFYRLKIFLGHRKGVYTFPQCNLHYCHVCLDMNTHEKLSLFGSYGAVINVSKMVHINYDNRQLIRCECGISHAAVLPDFVECTEDYVIDGRRRSCQCLDYSSDEDSS